jgi:GT2 family glycosyltransferase
MDYEIIIPSHRLQLSYEAQISIKDFHHRIFDGTNYPSFSKLINDCIVSSKCEYIIICSDKARPGSTVIEKILTMLDNGWGLVAPYRFGFFGFKKDLIRKIGFFDERYIGGGYEDNDIILRLKEANISYYENEEIDFIQIPSSWHYENSSMAAHYYATKWKQGDNMYIRRLPEENYGYDIGPFKNSQFLPFAASVLLPLRGNLIEQIMQIDLQSTSSP